MKRLTFIAVAVALFISACAPNKVRDSGGFAGPTEDTSRVKQVEPEARALFAQGEKAFGARDFELARKVFQTVRTKYPRGKAQLYAAYRLGVIEYYKENYAGASKDFEYYANRAPKTDLAFDATYNWAASEFQLQHFDKANQILGRIKVSEVLAQGPRRAETVFHLSARIAAATGNYPGVVASHALQLQLPLEEGVRIAVEDRVTDALSKIEDRARLEQLYTEITEPVTRQKIAERLNVLKMAVITPPQPPSGTPTFPTTEGLPSAAEIGRVELPSGGTSGDRRSIGVILPLSGKWGTYGRRALDGILLASRMFSSSAGDFQIFIKDSESSPLVAQSAVDELVEDKRVAAILGPIQWKESLAVAERAQQLGVMNLSLTAREGLSEKGAFLFQNALTPRVQLDTLVSFAINERKYTRFAILAPKSSYGKDMTRQFWDLVEKLGGKVVEYKTYPPEEKDFLSYIREMVGLGDLKYRKVEQTKLAEYIKEQKEKTKKEPKIQLPAIIDFDALFVPDSPNAVAQIAPSLAYFDVEGVPLLGTAEWNSELFFRRGGKYVDGAIFPAGLYLKTRNLRAREFIVTYQNAYGSSPDLLAAQAYEAMLLAAEAVRRAGADDRNLIVNALSALKEYETPLGVVSFDGTRTALRRLPILTLENGGQIVEH